MRSFQVREKKHKKMLKVRTFFFFVKMLNTIPTLQFLTDNTEGTSRRQQRQQNTIDYEQQQSHRQ